MRLHVDVHDVLVKGSRALALVLVARFGIGVSAATAVIPPDDPPSPPAGGSQCAALCPSIQPSDDVVDVRRCGATGNGADETLNVQCAAYFAAGKTLWIPAGYTFAVESLEGVRIFSRTKVTGGGTLKYVANASGNRLLEIRNAVDVSVSELTFDGNAANQPAPDCGGPPEHRHGIGIEQATGATVTHCVFKDLTGDGVYVADYDASALCSSRVLIQGNRFTGNYTSRTGVGVICGLDVRIQDNYFEGMGRHCMPGPIDLEADVSTQRIQDVVVSGNELVGPDGADCALVNGISVSGGSRALYDNVVISNNTIRGCFGAGIAVVGVASTGERPVVITGNALTDIGKGGDGRFSSAIMVTESDSYPSPWSPNPPDPTHPCGVPSGNPRPASAIVSDNTIRGVTEGYGIIVLDSEALVSGNAVVKADYWGIMYSAQCAPGHRGEVIDNRIVDCGDPGDASGFGGGIEVWGSDEVITGNNVLSFGAPNADLGIYLAYGIRNFVSGNVVDGIQGTNRSIVAAQAPQILEHNRWSLSSPAGEASIFGTYDPTLLNGTALDHTGYWKKGSLLYNPDPQVGSAVGWVCTASADSNQHAVWEPFGTIGASQFVTLNGAETLTHKTLTDPSNVFPPFVTRDGIERLTHKDLSDPSNILPKVQHPMVLVMMANTGSAVAWKMPTAVTELLGTTVRRMVVDLSLFSQFRLEAVQSVAGSSNAKLRAQYSTDQQSWLDLAATATAGDVSVANGGTPGINLGKWATIAAGGNADVYLRLVGTGGNGTAGPSWYTIQLQLK